MTSKLPFTMVFYESWNLLLRSKVCKLCKAIWALPFTIKPLLQTASLQLLLAAWLDSPGFSKFFGKKNPSLCKLCNIKMMMMGVCNQCIVKQHKCKLGAARIFMVIVMTNLKRLWMGCNLCAIVFWWPGQ